MGQNASKTYCFLGCSNLKKMCKVTIFISIHQLSGWHHLEFRPYMVQRRGNGKDFEVKKFCPLPLMTFFNQNVCVFYFILKELLATLWSADKSEEQEGEGGPPESYRRCPTSSQYRVSTIIWFQTIFFRFGIFRTKLARVLKVPPAFVVHWFPVGIKHISGSGKRWIYMNRWRNRSRQLHEMNQTPKKNIFFMFEEGNEQPPQEMDKEGGNHSI